MTLDPTRLTDPASGSSAALRDILRTAAGDVPSATQIQGLSAKLAAQLATPAAIGSAAGVTKAGVVTVRGVAKLAAVIFVAAAGGFGISALIAEHHTPPVADRAEVSTSPVAPVTPATTPIVPMPPMIETQPALPSAPPARRERRRAPATAVASIPTTSPSPTPSPSFARDEVTLLGEAKRALAAGDGVTALELADAHATQFPSGALLEEREAIATEALVALGRTPEARARLDRFHDQFPQSGYHQRLERLVDQR
ncbi:MAG: hypothetical protein AB7O24_00720 [Kofleriaceae bacterium]